MPTYQYACTECDEQIEVVQKFTDDPLTECVACGCRLRKVFSPVGIVFKGSGFYHNDSRATANGGANGAKDEKKEKEPATSDETSSTGKSDSAGESSKSGDSKSSKESKSSESSSKPDSGGSSGGKGTEKVA